MIHRVYSRDLETFKNLEFKAGLNILMADRTPSSGRRQTRNRSGKSSLVQLINMLLGGDLKKGSIFLSDALADFTFNMDLDVGPHLVRVERKGRQPSEVKVTAPATAFPGIATSPLFNVKESRTVGLDLWRTMLGVHMFGLPDHGGDKTRISARSLLAYFARVQRRGGFSHHDRHFATQNAGDAQISTAFLVGLDTHNLVTWQEWRERMNALENLKKAAKFRFVDDLLGVRSHLVKQLSETERKIAELRPRVEVFASKEAFMELEAEAAMLTLRISELSVDQEADKSYQQSITALLADDSPVPLDDVSRVYQELGVVFPDAVLKRFEDVERFHFSVVRNRRAHLSSELRAIEDRLDRREIERTQAEKRREQILDILQTEGVLETFTKLQGELARLEASAASIRTRLTLDDQIKAYKARMQGDLEQLIAATRAQLDDQREIVGEVARSVEGRLRAMYDTGGRVTFEVTKAGLVSSIDCHGKDGEAVHQMTVFCWDLAIMEALARRQTGPGFLVHDSHLFDGVDPRQVGTALALGAEAATRFGFQYVVTLNSDALRDDQGSMDFDPAPYLLDVKLTDATETGGLFGFRFG